VGEYVKNDKIEQILKGTFDIEIPNFKKWNPDTRHRRTWFALSVDWNNDPKVHRLSASEKITWLLLLTYRARASSVPSGDLKGASSVPLQSLNIAWCQPHVGLKGTSVVPALVKLAKLQLINLRCVSLHNKTIQDRQDKHTRVATSVAETSKFDFESLYKKYPRKIGKSQGLTKCKRLVKTEMDFILLEKAILRFCEHHTAQGTEPQFIPYFSTFINNWRDWLDPETGSATVKKEKTWEDIAREQGTL